MNFLKTIKPFQLITAIIDRNKNKTTKEEDLAKSEEATPKLPLTTENGTKQAGPLPDCDENISFLLSLRRVSTDRDHSENLLKRKISLFQNVQIEPHYLSAAEESKLLNFQFQLGSDIFLERVEHLHQQVTQITTVIKEVLATRKQDAFLYLIKLNALQNDILQLIDRIKAHRKRLTQIKEQKCYKVLNLIRKKNILKEKIRLLKNVKTKNEAAFLDITNIDQAFATEQSRSKLYKKINKLTELQKSKYVCTIKNRLVSVCRHNLRFVEEGITAWVEGRLNVKQIQKLSFMIYFMEKEDIYRQNGIRIDLGRVDRSRLREEVRKIKEWKTFHYVKDLMTKDRIHEFLDYLLSKIQG